jgi:hypothetical protein
MERDSLPATQAKRREAVLFLQATEGSLDGCAAFTEGRAYSAKTGYDMRVVTTASASRP